MDGVRHSWLSAGDRADSLRAQGPRTAVVIHLFCVSGKIYEKREGRVRHDLPAIVHVRSRVVGSHGIRMRQGQASGDCLCKKSTTKTSPGVTRVYH
jgi:hypothetical protein